MNILPVIFRLSRRPRSSWAIAGAAAIVAPLLAMPASAEEGMWLFDRPPVEAVAREYGVQLTPAFLGWLRVASVRFDSGGSGSFVSSSGLVLTNHHVASDCIQGLSSAERDLMRQGFLAAGSTEELRCPSLSLDSLRFIRDITADTQERSAGRATEAETNMARKSALAAQEKECKEQTGLHCEAVTLYAGAAYALYAYERFTDVRLVWSPELDVAFFGGDPDNFTYPRYCLDAALLRVYRDDKPVVPPAYLPLSPEGAAEGEPVFVTGHPGRTNRLKTTEELKTLREVIYPLYTSTIQRALDALDALTAADPTSVQRATDERLSLENGRKALGGYLQALQSAELQRAKDAGEKDMLSWLAARPDAGEKALAGAWKTIAKAEASHREVAPAYLLLERRFGVRGQLAGFARELIRYHRETAKAEGERLPEYASTRLEALRRRLLSEAPVHADVEQALLEASLERLEASLGAKHPAVVAALGAGKQRRGAAERARELVEGTRLADPAARKALLEGPASAVDSSSDSMIALMRALEPSTLAARKRYEDEVEAPSRTASASVAKAGFLRWGFSQYPDATFTLRLSTGRVASVTATGAEVPAFTTLAGLYQLAGTAPVYNLPERWQAAKESLRLDTPFNLITTNDIIGGNSGSPLVNAQGETVGLIFDGNLASLAWNFSWQQDTARAVAVDSRAILETLDKVYGATGLLGELRAR